MAKCYWVTGLSATGKTTLSNLMVKHLRLAGNQVIHFDGDDLRQVLADEAYTREERIALGMRYSRLCQLIVEQDINVVISVIGLFRELHEWNRKNIQNYIEIFIDTPLIVFYSLLNSPNLGEIKNVAGMDLDVDFPVNPDIHIKWSKNKTIDSMYKELHEGILNWRKKE